MIAINHDVETDSANWQSEFLRLLPTIEQQLRQAFRHRDPASLEAAVADGVVTCMWSFRTLREHGRASSVTGSNLAWFAAKQIRNGRAAECYLKSTDPLSRYAQLRRGIRVERLPDGDLQDREWIDALAVGSRSTVLDQVAARLDIADWLTKLGHRTRQIAKDLAQGESTSEVAHKHGVSASRISQLRRELAESWREFQHESTIEK